MSHREIQSQIDHLFRQEAGKMVAVLVHIFGASNFELAEDVVQETLLTALKTWRLKGIPTYPKAWLYRVSKNKAIDLLRKRKHHPLFSQEGIAQQLLNSGYTIHAQMDAYWEPQHITDDFLGMMFACCHPSISQENQVTFMLKVLGGFSIQEIANAFITSNAVISKRLLRTKDFFRKEQIKPRLPREEELSKRINSVTSCIYLLFNEGYKSTHSTTLVRQDLIDHAIYLTKTLLENEKTRFSSVYALMALFHFQGARTKSRVSSEGKLIVLKDQDRSVWDQLLIAKGRVYLNHSLQGPLSSYHLEAGIAYEHCKAKHFKDTNWDVILAHYDKLVSMTKDPVVALHRALVIMEKEGAPAALTEIEAIEQHHVLQSYYVYHAALGELFFRLQAIKRAIFHLKKALSLCSAPLEKHYLNEKIEQLSALS